MASLEEFKRQREQLKSNMESLEKQLISQEEKHKVELHNLEMTVLLEKKRSVNQTLRVQCPTIVSKTNFHDCVLLSLPSCSRMTG